MTIATHRIVSVVKVIFSKYRLTESFPNDDMDAVAATIWTHQRDFTHVFFHF